MSRKRGKQGSPPEGFSRRDFLKGASVAVSSGLIVTTTLEGAPPDSAVIKGPGPVPFTLKVNGKVHQLNLEPRVTLLDALRDELDITGAKRVCDRATCGACTVLKDGAPIYACTTLAIEAEGHEITTIEGLVKEGQHTPVMKALVDHDGQQCGFCTPGFVMACTAFLKKHPHPTLEEVEHGLGGNLCRCGTYDGIRHAVLQAAREMKGGPTHG
jgi:xanthine dehydrogenase YagT iron-sulfur-binding subunit